MNDAPKPRIDLAYLANEHERRAVEQYDLLFCEALLETLPPLAGAQTVLDLDADTGLAAFAVARRLSPESCLVAVADETHTLDQLHSHAVVALPADIPHAQFFPRREDLPRLPFANEVFDLAYACLPLGELYEARGLLTQAFRVLRPAGAITLTTPLTPSFLELAHAVTELATSSNADRPAPTRHLAARQQLLSLAEWEGLLTRAGFTDISAQTRAITLVVPQDAYRHELYTTRLAPLYISTASDPVAMASRLLKGALNSPLTTTVHIGVLCGTKPASVAVPPGF